MADNHGFRKQISVDISGSANIHNGFGTGTSIYLACLEALMLINAHPTNDSALIQSSGRGGTSGIGIRTYFHGGLVVDLGRQSDGKRLQPSSLAEAETCLPLLLQRTTMPDWNIGICIPTHIRSLTSKDEMLFFEETCPIPENECHRAFYHGVAGVFSAVQEQDQVAFQNSVQEIQECEWKRAERAQHGRLLHELENRLYSMGASAVGMSSLGPSLFFLADQIDSSIQKMQLALPNCKFIKCLPNNSGRKIEWLN